MKDKKSERNRTLNVWAFHIIQWWHLATRQLQSLTDRVSCGAPWLATFLFRRTRMGRTIQQILEKLDFFFNRQVFVQSEQIHEIVKGSKIGQVFIHMALSSILSAGFFISLLVGVPFAYSSLAAQSGWPPLSMPRMTVEGYDSLLATVAQAAAAILALFFTIVGVVISTTYAKLTTRIRLIVVEDDLNRKFLMLLAHTAVVAIVGLGLSAAFDIYSLPLLLYVIFLASISIFVFLPLGIRSFSLFDPASLSHYPIQRFFRGMNLATNKSRNWLSPPFQKHANTLAEEQMQILEELLVFASTEQSLNGTSLRGLASDVQNVARLYSAEKHRIPTESLWFTRQAKFRRWEVQDSFTSDLTLNTGVTPSPNLVPNITFIETHCTDMILQSLDKLLQQKFIDEIVTVLNEINVTAHCYARHYDQESAIYLVDSARKRLIQFLCTVDMKTETMKYLQVVDVLCVAALAPILDASLALTEVSVETLIAVETPLLTMNQRGIYTTTLPRTVLKVVEDLYQRLDFERSAEGEIYTQPWFVRQLIALAFADHIRETIRGIVETIKQDFVAPAKSLVTAKQVLMAGVWLQRGIEACKKAQNRISALDERYKDFETFHVTNLTWQPSGATSALIETEQSRKEIVALLASVVPELCTIPAGDGLPDFLGQARAWIAEELISMMESQQIEGFVELFYAYFNASMKVQQHYYIFSQEPEKSHYINAAFGCLVDVMDICGLALLFSELDNAPYGKIVRQAWDIFIKQSPNPNDIIVTCYHAIDAKLSLPFFSSSAMQRQNWSRRLAAAMIQRGIKPHNPYREWSNDRDNNRHPNPIIETVRLSLEHPMHDLNHYFGSLYLSRLDAANGVPLPHSIKSCLESIKREEKDMGDANAKDTE